MNKLINKTNQTTKILLKEKLNLSKSKSKKKVFSWENTMPINTSYFSMIHTIINILIPIVLYSNVTPLMKKGISQAYLGTKRKLRSIWSCITRSAR